MKPIIYHVTVRCLGRLSAFVLVGGLAGLLVGGCGPTGPDIGGNDNQEGNTNQPGVDAAVISCEQAPGDTICIGTVEVVCDDNGVESRRRDCADMGLYCDYPAGCVACLSGQTQCDGNTVQVCREDQMGWEPLMDCDPAAGDQCSNGRCVNACAEAENNRSNVGCDYVAVDMGNIDESGANEGCFAVLVSNVQDSGEATVTVEDEQGNLLDFPGYGTERVIGPRALEVFVVSGSAGMCTHANPAVANAASMTTGILPGTAFRVKSNMPVVAYQINPYEAANIHTTDAALLIPVPALGSQYMVATYSGLSQAPSEISIVAVEDNTPVSVTPSVPLTAGGQVPGSGPFQVTLNAMEHLQIVASGTGDLSGTLVSAGTVDTSEPIAVFAGAGCANIPTGLKWCDHLEEQLPDVQAWGWTYIAAPPPQRATEKTFWRIVGAVEGTTVIFEPSRVSPPATLGRGEYLHIEASEPFLVSSDQDHPIEVMNLMKGAEATAADSGMDPDQLGNLRGDPAITLSVPVEQYLDAYVFLSDPTYAYNFVVVVRTSPSQQVHLDCFDPIPDNRFVPVSGDYAIATVVLSSENSALKPPDGSCQDSGQVHSIWSTQPFGIWVYGYYQDTSYGYPGGMNLERVNDVVVVE